MIETPPTVTERSAPRFTCFVGGLLRGGGGPGLARHTRHHTRCRPCAPLEIGAWPRYTSRVSHPTAGDAALYKICPRHSWAEALQTGQLPVSGDDARDGYIHLSSAQQLRGTLERHFKAQPDLVLLVIP